MKWSLFLHSVSFLITFTICLSCANPWHLCLQIHPAHCTPNPCQNSARCFNTQADYYCHCPENWEGKNCSIPRIQCVNPPCTGERDNGINLLRHKIKLPNIVPSNIIVMKNKSIQFWQCLHIKPKTIIPPC